MNKTFLSKWHDVDGIYTRDRWEIPADGTDIWCTAWKRGQLIIPQGDGMHVNIGLDVFHVDEFMSILDRLVSEGHKWGIDGVEMTREQKINGYWTKVDA